jgi:hypothetical protein
MLIISLEILTGGAPPMRPSVLLGLLAVVSPFSSVLADVSVRSPTTVVAASNDKVIQAALEKAKAAVDELNAMLEQKEVIIVEEEPKTSAVPLEFNDVLRVLADLEAVDDALWKQEEDRLKRRNLMRYADIDPLDKEARRKASLSASAFFAVQVPAIDQLAIAHEKIMSEKKSGMVAAAEELNSKLQVLDTKVADSIFTKPAASSFYIAAARLREELRLANLPHAIKYNEQVRLRASYDRLRNLGVAAVKACTATLAISAMPALSVSAVVNLFAQVSTAIDLIHEVLEVTAEEVEGNTMADAIIILEQMLAPYKQRAEETYEKASEVVETVRAKIAEKMAEYEEAKRVKRLAQEVAAKKQAELAAEKQAAQDANKKASSEKPVAQDTKKASPAVAQPEEDEATRLARELEDLTRVLAQLEAQQAKK